MTQPTLEPTRLDSGDGSGHASVVPDNPSLTMVEMVDFVRRHFRRLALSTTAAALLALLVFGWALPRKFEAAATLIVMPSGLSSDLRPQAMSVQGFQRLLESDQVVVETRNRLATEHDIQAELTLGRNIHSKIYVSRREEVRMLAPVIELYCRASDPDRAAKIANMWADVFLEKIHQIQSSSTEANIRLVEALYLESREGVSSLEETRLGEEMDFRTRLVSARQKWNQKLEEASSRLDRQIGKVLKESTAKITEYQLETRHQMAAVIEEFGIVSADDMAESTAGEPAVGLDELANSRLVQLVGLRTQLAQTLEVMTLEKGVSNDAIWQTVLLQQSELIDGERLWTSRLATEERNPIYTDLLLRVSELETQLESSLSKVSDRRAVDRALTHLEELQRRRNAELKSLHHERIQSITEAEQGKSRALADLQLDRERELMQIRRQGEVKLGQIDRRLENQRRLLADMSERFSKAEFARGEQELADIRMGAMALPPFEPRPRNLAVKLGICTLLGLCIGLIAGIVHDVSRD